MSFRTHLPVLIVGAGPTGLITANLLGIYGIPAVLVDTRPSVNRGPRSTFLDDEFFRLLETVGLADEVRRQVLGPTTYEQYSPLGFLLSREEGQITLHNYPTRSAIYQPWFDQTLLDGLSRFEHVEVLLGHAFTDLHDDGDKVTVGLRHGDQQARRAFSYVLGADGSRSPVRDALGISFEPVTPHEMHSLRIDVEGDPDTAFVMRSRPGFKRSCSSFPAPNGRRYGFSILPGEDPAKLMTDEALHKLLRDYVGYDNVRIINRAHYTFRSRLASRFRAGRVFLLGDAAHTQPPAGSQGMNSGARDANALAWKLAAVLQESASPELLDLYERERLEPMRATVAQAATGIRRHLRKRGVAATVVGDLWIKLKTLAHLRQPAWQRQVQGSHVATGRATRVTSGVLAGQVTDQEDDLLGRALPNPWVHAGPRGHMLDKLLGTGFALVGFNTGDSLPAGAFHPLWTQLRVKTVVVHNSDRDSTAPGHGQFTTARLADHRLDEFWKRHEGRWLVVRPDRIVAAVSRPDDLESTADELATRLGVAPPRLAVAV